jgi:predicted transposase YdaD
MSRPFDTSLKELIELDPLGWARFFSPLPVESAQLIDSDLATLLAMADKVLRVQTPGLEYLMQVELQASHSLELVGRLHLYSAALTDRHRLPVRTVVLLLRPEANASNLRGLWEQRFPGEEAYLTFRYDLIRVWTQPLQGLLQGPLGLLPLAGLTDEAQGQIETVVAAMVQRVRREAPTDRTTTIETALFTLLGLRQNADLIARLIEGVREMEESSFYQLILRRGEERGRQEGRQEGIALGERQGAERGARQTILRLARRKLGEPSPEQLARLEAIADLDRLEQIADRMFNDIRTWDELLAES